MANLKDIRLRIASTKNTQQITKAMKMVSAARLRRAQSNILNLRPYAKQLLSVISDIAATHRVHHPLLSSNTDFQKVLLIVLTSDRGLCGGFNANINRFALKYYQENTAAAPGGGRKFEKFDVMFIGRKASEFFKGRKITGVDTILNLAREISFDMASKVADRLMEDFSVGGYDAVYVIYNEFKSAISQTVACEQLLPVDLSKQHPHETSVTFSKDLIFEPKPEQMIDQMLKRHFAVQMYRIMCESVAGEHGARMTAMENATKNAGEMIAAMTLTYNKLRQASITTELIEITSGAEALKG